MKTHIIGHLKRPEALLPKMGEAFGWPDGIGGVRNARIRISDSAGARSFGHADGPAGRWYSVDFADGSIAWDYVDRINRDAPVLLEPEGGEVRFVRKEDQQTAILDRASIPI